MDKKESQAGEGEDIEASGDAILVSDALAHIGEGLFAIASAITRYAAAMMPDQEIEEEDLGQYLDGTRK